jgi:aldose sugar dehydrogenase
MGNSATYVGRVGGLAVALGIGAAVASGQEVAWAAPSTSSSDSSGSSSTSSSASSEASSESSPGWPGSAQGASAAGSTAGATQSTTAGSAGASASAQLRTGRPDRPVVSSSGGPHTSSNPSASFNTASDDRSASAPTSNSEGSTTGPVDTKPATSGPAASTPATGQPAATPPAEPASSQPAADVTNSPTPPSPSAHHWTATTHNAGQADSKTASDAEAQPPSTSTTATANGTGQPALDPSTRTTADTTPAQAVESAQPATTTTSTSTSAATATMADSQPVIAQAAPAALATPVTAPRIITGLLAAFGLSPLATNTPLAPVEPPAMWALLAWTRRQSAQTALNQAPTTVANPTQNSLVAGAAAPVDVVEPVVAATVPVPGNPLVGGVVVSPNVANAQPAIAQAALASMAPTMSPPTQPLLTTSTMPVTQANVVTGFLPGVLSASRVEPAVTTTAAAPVQAAAAQSGPASLFQILQYTFFNQPPTANPTQSPGQSATGVVTGNLNASGPNGAPLTYTVTQNPTQGSVVMNPDGSYTYTPTANLANRPFGTDQFTVTIDDASAYRLTGVAGVIQGMLHSLAQAIGLSGPDIYAANITVTPQNGLPAGISRTVLLSGLNQPIDFVFLPGGSGEGDILIAEKSGAILVYDRLTTGQLQNEPLITLPVSTTGERGISGLAVDPQYGTNGHNYIYVAYTSTNNYDQVSRFTVTEDPQTQVLTADPASELLLLTADQPSGDSHHGGGLQFGPDGKLYWAIGDNFYPPNAQNLSTVYGKVLRLNPDSTNPPADNPFVNTPGANPYIYAYGFRNPFRMTFAPDGQLLVADVGQASWEELDNVTAGGNYGWPFAEGVCPGTGMCAPGVDFGSFVNPIYAYPHDPTLPLYQQASITSVLVYTNSLVGQTFQNKVFIADYTLGWIKVLTCTSDYSSCGSETMFDNQAGTTVKLAQEADGDIYQLTINPGQLLRIAPSAG